jgi:putative FmdB family regulatory protein
MPLYEYECDACGKRFENIRKFSDPPLEICAKCGKGPVRRLMSAPAFQFKGSGWYITDYAKKGTTDSSSTSDSTGKSETSDKNSDTAKTTEKSESKPAATETKTESKPSTGTSSSKD